MKTLTVSWERDILQSHCKCCADLDMLSQELSTASFCDNGTTESALPRLFRYVDRYCVSLVQVSLDLSSFELVEHCKETLLQLLQEGLVDIVACNEEEVEAFSKVSPSSLRNCLLLGKL